MIQDKTYVRKNEQGAWRVGALDVSLDSVVIAYQQGYSAETIQQLLPALTLEEVYGAIDLLSGQPERNEPVSAVAGRALATTSPNCRR